MGPRFMVSIEEILKGGHTGKAVELRGWIYRTRTVGGKAFVVVRDSTGTIQVAIARDVVSAEAFKAAEKALIESAVIVRGKVVSDKRAPGGYEIRAEDIKVIHFAEKFPIQEDQSEEFLLDVRHLWVRSQRMTTIFRIRHTVFGAVHQYFRDHGFWEVSPPMITPAGSEGGATLFEVEYFGRKAYLTQSWQLYAEALVLAMVKIYYLGPSFRAEKPRTTRHLTEYWHAEVEQAWPGIGREIRHAEGVISDACQRAAEGRPDDVAGRGRALRSPAIRERAARGFRDGNGTVASVDLQARAHPRCGAVPADSGALFPIGRTLIAPPSASRIDGRRFRRRSLLRTPRGSR